ncbi:MAG: LamG-like jellyroll fold domain-containing protein [Verrucomicrobiota bacterium]
MNPSIFDAQCLAWICLLMLPGMIIPVDALGASPLEDAQAKYAVATNKIEQAYLAALDQAMTTYLNALKARSRFYQSQGKLENVLAIQKITDAVSETNDVPRELQVEGLPELNGMHKRFVSQAGKALVARDAQTETLLTNYLKHLNALEKQLVKNNEIETAVLARTEARSKLEPLKAVRARITERRKSYASTSTYLSRGGLPPSLRKELMLYLSFDQNEKGKVTGQSDRKQDAQVSGATWTAKGKVKGAYEYDGDDYIEAGDLGEAPPEGTIAFWIYPAEIANYRNPFSTKRAGGNAGFRFEENESGGFGIAAGNDGGHFHGHTITEDLKAEAWYHVVVTWDMPDNRLRGYLNGSPVFDDAHELWPTTFPNVAVGTGFSTGGERQWKGKIDELMIWKRALSAAEIKQLHRTQQ